MEEALMHVVKGTSGLILDVYGYFALSARCQVYITGLKLGLNMYRLGQGGALGKVAPIGLNFMAAVSWVGISTETLGLFLGEQ